MLFRSEGGRESGRKGRRYYMLTTALGYGVKEDGEMEEEECRNEVKLKMEHTFLGVC